MRDITWYKDSLKLLKIKHDILIHNIYTDIREAHNIGEEMKKQVEELQKLLGIYNNSFGKE